MSNHCAPRLEQNKGTDSNRSFGRCREQSEPGKSEGCIDAWLPRLRPLCRATIAFLNPDIIVRIPPNNYFAH